MSVYRYPISLIIYFTALLVLLVPGIFVLIEFYRFIVAGDGVGIYGAIIYYAAAFVSSLLWAISYFMNSNKRYSVIYWSIFILLTGFIALQPTWWAAP